MRTWSKTPVKWLMVIGVMLFVIAQASPASFAQGSPSGTGSVPNFETQQAARGHRPAAPRITVGANPTGAALDPYSGTLYVATGEGISLIDARHCSASTTIGCGQAVRTLPLGSNDIGILFDQQTRTVYFSSAAENFVGVIDAVHCNVHDFSRCAVVPHIPVASFPTGLAIDSGSGTLYVANSGEDVPGHTVSLIDTAACNGHRSTGCHAVGTVEVGAGPAAFAIDQASGTVYVANFFDNDVSVFDARTCNVHTRTYCNDLVTIPVGGSAADVRLDSQTHTVYVAVSGDGGLGHLSMVNTLRCNAHQLADCRLAPPIAKMGAAPIALTSDAATRTLYAVNQEDSSVAIIDENRCNARRADGCRSDPYVMRGDFDAGGATVDEKTHTVYYTSQGQNTVTVLAGSRCNAMEHSGCDRHARTTTTEFGPAGLAVEEQSQTIYVTNQESDSVSVIDAAACSTKRLADCVGPWPTVRLGQGFNPKSVDIDPGTHTAYVADDYNGTGPGTVSFFDTRTCNAHNHAGCGLASTQVTVPGGAYALAVDPTSHTIYVAEVDQGTVSIIDGRRCSVVDRSGCASAITTVPAGQAPAGVAVDPGSHTLYVADRTAGTVQLLNTSTCNALVRSDCAIQTVTRVGEQPRFMAVDRADHTLYVTNRLDGTVSMIDIGRCNAAALPGCTFPSPATKVGDLPYGIAVNPRSDMVYVGNVGDSTVTTFHSTRCNATVQSGCANQHTIGTGGWPASVAVDLSTGTVFVANNVDATLNVIGIGRR